MVSEIVHSVLSDNTNRRVTAIEETATKAATPSTAKQPKKDRHPTKKHFFSHVRSAIPSDNELAGKTCPLCGKGTIIKEKPRMAVQNGKTGVPTGSRSDNHTFLCTRPTKFVYYRIQASLYPEKHCASL